MPKLTKEAEVAIQRKVKAGWKPRKIAKHMGVSVEVVKGVISSTNNNNGRG